MISRRRRRPAPAAGGLICRKGAPPMRRRHEGRRVRRGLQRRQRCSTAAGSENTAVELVRPISTTVSRSISCSRAGEGWRAGRGRVCRRPERCRTSRRRATATSDRSRNPLDTLSTTPLSLRPLDAKHLFRRSEVAPDGGMWTPARLATSVNFTDATPICLAKSARLL